MTASGQVAQTHILVCNHESVRPCPPFVPSCPALGVDLSECLQYPDFSVVVLYKKVVVGFGFMVPDVKYNEAYISFLLVHPEWRRAGIGTFMIYHLIQVRLRQRVLVAATASSHRGAGIVCVQCSMYEGKQD